MENLKLEVLYVIAEIKIRIILDNRYGAIMKNDNKTYRYYVVKWYGPSYEFQEETDRFQAGDVVCNAT